MGVNDGDFDCGFLSFFQPSCYFLFLSPLSSQRFVRLLFSFNTI